MKTELDKRLELHSLFEEILGSSNVYFQPPSTKQMHYPAIVYSRNNVDEKFANNKVYNHTTAYRVIVIDEDPDSEFVTKVLELPMCSFDQHYAVNNLNHDAFTLYY